MTKQILYYDSPPDLQLNHTFAVIKIKNVQHRRILNRQPVTKEVSGFHVLLFDLNVMSN